VSAALRVRPACTADREACLALYRALQEEQHALDPHFAPSTDAAARWRNDFGPWLRSASDAVWVADAEGAVVGLATAHLFWPPPVQAQRLLAHVDEVIVDVAWRGRGVGRRLVEAAAAWARAGGAQSLEAGVLAANADALAFWRAAGARPHAVRIVLPLP
jgi:GNAT superfamily N-acetyltransferase